MHRTITLSCTLALAAASTSFAGGTDFSITRSVIATGGGTSTGGAFSVTGTAGETGAATTLSFGGRFDLASGFWAGRPAVMWPELQITEVTPASRTLVIAPARGPWRMDYSTDLLLWQPIFTNTAFAASATVTISGPPGLQRYYRLVRLTQ